MITASDYDSLAITGYLLTNLLFIFNICNHYHPPLSPHDGPKGPAFGG